MNIVRNLRARVRRVRLSAGLVLDAYGDPIQEDAGRIELIRRDDGSWGGIFHCTDGSTFEADVLLEGADLTRLRAHAQTALERPVSGDESLSLAERVFKAIAAGKASLIGESYDDVAIDEVEE